MEELCYSALDLAAIISSMGLGCRATADFLERVWEGERPFLQKIYRKNKRQLILDVNYWLTYLSDKPAIDAEFPVIQQDALTLGNELPADAYTDDCEELDLFFKNVRLRILYSDGKDYVRIKRRTLMARYGYKRLSAALVEHFARCTYFYHLQPYVRNWVECQIKNVGMDEMIIFRII
ncbi:MAG: hypothetical protein HDT18_06350 [Oscillibacter sp.]|nr:hypothetical protein [Oscillibacter sp.]